MSRAKELADAIRNPDAAVDLIEVAAMLDELHAIMSAAPGEVGEIQRKVTGIRALPWESQANALLVDLETLLAIVQRLSVDLTIARAEVERLKSEKTALAAENARLVNEHAATMSRADVLAEGVRHWRLSMRNGFATLATRNWELQHGHMVSK